MGSLEYYFSKVGYANNTTCIESTDLELIKLCLINIFEKENYRFISQPSLFQDADLILQELLSAPYKVTPYLWVVGLSTNNSGWTTIKTSVEDLLCRKRTKNNKIWLSQLAVDTRCNVFHHNVQERDWGVLLEANKLGEILATGIPLEIDNPNEMKFYDIPIAEAKRNGNFFLLDVPEIFQQAGKEKYVLSQQEQLEKNKDLEKMFRQGEDEEIKRAIEEWTEVNMGGRERLDRDLGNLICKPYSFWNEQNILYKVYSETNKLRQNRIELMFFQVGRLDVNPTTEDIWSPIKNFTWVDYGIDLKKINFLRK